MGIEQERLLKMDEHHLYEFSLLRLTTNQQYLQSIIIFKNIYSTLNDLNPVEQLVWGLSEKPFPGLQLLFILLIYQTWKGSKKTVGRIVHIACDRMYRDFSDRGAQTQIQGYGWKCRKTYREICSKMRRLKFYDLEVLNIEIMKQLMHWTLERCVTAATAVGSVSSGSRKAGWIHCRQQGLYQKAGKRKLLWKTVIYHLTITIAVFLKSISAIL